MNAWSFIKLRYEFFICSKVFDTPSSYLNHIKNSGIHQDEREYETDFDCVYCGDCFSNRSDLANHVDRAEGHPYYEYPCTYSCCGKSFGSKQAIAQHASNSPSHDLNRRYGCDLDVEVVDCIRRYSHSERMEQEEENRRQEMEQRRSEWRRTLMIQALEEKEEQKRRKAKEEEQKREMEEKEIEILEKNPTSWNVAQTKRVLLKSGVLKDDVQKLEANEIDGTSLLFLNFAMLEEEMRITDWTGSLIIMSFVESSKRKVSWDFQKWNESQVHEWLRMNNHN